MYKLKPQRSFCVRAENTNEIIYFLPIYFNVCISCQMFEATRKVTPTATPFEDAMRLSSGSGIHCLHHFDFVHYEVCMRVCWLLPFCSSQAAFFSSSTQYYHFAKVKQRFSVRLNLISRRHEASRTISLDKIAAVNCEWNEYKQRNEILLDWELCSSVYIRSTVFSCYFCCCCCCCWWWRAVVVMMVLLLPLLLTLLCAFFFQLVPAMPQSLICGNVRDLTI